MENNRMGEFLAALRKSKGYTQQEVADSLGVSNKTVSSWETGASCPDISMLPVLAELYGVTCDELIRGKRLSGEEELSPAGRKKAMEHLLQRQKTNLFTVCWIAGGLAGIALLLTSLIGFAALESPIGFFVGLIFQAASIITAVICIRRLRFQAGEPWESEPALRFSLSLDRALFWIVIANVAVFGFDAPHCFAPAHAGLALDGETLLLLLLFVLGAAALTFLIGWPVLLRVQKKRLLAAVDRASDEQSGAFTALMRQNTLSVWKIKRIPLLIVLPFAVLLALSLIFLAIPASSEADVVLQSTYTFTLREGAALSQNSPFDREEYTLVSEEQPENETETGKYEVVYLFPSFPEEWRGYYRTQETEDGTLVTIYKYRAASEEGNIAEFYAYDYRWQGELRYIEVSETGTEGELYVEAAFGPSLFEQADVTNTILFLSIGGAFGALALLSFAVTVPLYVKQERKFKKTL